MPEPPCRLLDDFLARDLPDTERAAFERHLPECADCRKLIQAQARLSAQLGAALDRFEPPPANIIGAVEQRFRRMRRIRLAGATAALAAGLALLALWAGQSQSPQESPKFADSGPLPPPLAAVRVRFPDPNVVAVPIESGLPNVTVLAIYSNFSAATNDPAKASERTEP
jgi:anti-sigma factor RsiW